MKLDLITNPYERRARLYPALLLVMPAVVAGMVISGTSLADLQRWATTLVGCGAAFFLSQLARDSGKAKEIDLFESLGGMPSITILRHRNRRIDPITKARYHHQLALMVKGTKPPTATEEELDPDAADLTYSAWSSYLRVHTRERNDFPLVFAELVNYGYRRNLWGLQVIGSAVSGASFLLVSTWAYVEYQHRHLVSTRMLGAFVIDGCFLLLWAFRFTPSWVRIAADAYAQRLVEAVDVLSASNAD